MTVRELREKYLRFFESKGHSRFPSAPLVPYDVTGRLDESLLFTGAGMVQFKPYFRGIARPDYPRLATCQKCVRTGDIESVGDPSHLTFFEMLGNFSFGDYFKPQAIAYSWEFLTSPEWLGLDPRRLSFTVFEEDDEAFDEWARWLIPAGIDPETRVFRLGEDTNYWPAGSFSSGPPGPCGPNSEMFYWVPADEPPPSGPYSREDWLRDDEAGKWLEIWNDVFIQFEWQGHPRNPERPSDGWVKDGMPPLPFQSIDTGMGLERTVATLNGQRSAYQSDAFLPIFRRLADLASAAAPRGERGSAPVHVVLQAMAQGLIPEDRPTVQAARVIADHIRTAVFCIADGVLPGNSGRGYVLRRLIRRAVLKGQRQLGFEDLFLFRVFEGVVEAMGDHYTELRERRDTIVETLRNEEALFRKTLLEGTARLLTFSYALLGVSHALEQALEFIMSRGVGRENAYSVLEQYGLTPHVEVQQTSPSEGRPEIKTERWWPAFEYFLNALEDSGRLQVAESRHAVLSSAKTLPGDFAFRLYDTYGFPLEVTQELAEEAGLKVDLEGYETALREAQARSRQADGRESVYGNVALRFEITVQTDDGRPTPTVFTGYEELATPATIVGALPAPAEDSNVAPGALVLALDRTPFYPQSGGQVADTGLIRGEGFELRVSDVTRQEGVIVHMVEPQGPMPPLERLFNQPVEARVDTARRARIRRNHTATHLLHAALREVLGKHVTQAGSYVGPDRLRFDFTHGKAMSPQELAEVERIVNERALANDPVVTYADVPLNDAKAMGAMALFGEKYADRVRVVQVGPESPQECAFSRELCGGTHVRSTGEVGLFKIVSESSAASGIRRVEAVTGEGAYEWALDQSRVLREAASILKASPAELAQAAERALEQQRELQRRLERMRTQAAGATQAQIKAVGPVELAVERLTEGEVKDATLVADRLSQNQPNRVALVGLASDGKVTFVCKVGPEALTKGAHAGNLVREVAKLAGGGGGGRPDFATAGGKQPEKLEEALIAAEALLQAMVGA